MFGHRASIQQRLTRLTDLRVCRLSEENTRQHEPKRSKPYHCSTSHQPMLRAR